MSKKFNPLSTAIALAVATAMVGGCAMQTRNGDMARADTEDSSHPSTNTTLTAQGDPVPDVTQVAVVEQPAPVVQVAQADPMPAQPAPAAQQWNDNTTTVAAADTTTAMPAQPAYNSTPATQPSTTATDANSSYSNSDQLAPRADRN